MGISGRKEKIIQAVVDSYIVSCEPISSAEIKENYLPDLSSATIRNELAALEEMGYLAQPHTSSGRVPTAEAYRLYVDKLMPKRKLSRSELKVINRYFDHKITEIDAILKNTAKVISEITNLTSVAVIPDITGAVVDSIKIVKLNDSSALVVIVTNLGILKDATVEIASALGDEYFTVASNFISAAFKGKTIGEIIQPDDLIEEIKKEYRQLFKAIIKIIRDYVEEGGVGDIVLEGSTKILSQPEYANVEKARAMLEMLEAKEQLVPMLKSPENVSLNIKIGRDNEMADGVPECAIVTANYQVNGVTIGNAGVIGPIRMDYSKVVSVLDYIGKTLNVLPDSGEGGEKDENQ
ncbi:MAG: heat-inducible transcriptional repressor HrcA [Christensenellales bacterium]|jgi:heat-inducible transcription repressor hrcA